MKHPNPLKIKIIRTKIMHKLKILGFIVFFFLLTNSLLFSQDFKNIKGNIVFFDITGIEYSPKSKILSLINTNRGRLLTNILVVNMVKDSEIGKQILKTCFSIDKVEPHSFFYYENRFHLYLGHPALLANRFFD